MSDFAITVDRTLWPPGPWDDEPNSLDWVMSEPPHYRCLMLRNEKGAWCGYVSLPISHPYVERCWQDAGYPPLRAPGGVNYSHRVQHDGETLWLVGFDCMHFNDGCPGMVYQGALLGTYRDAAFVRAAVESLALQLAEVK